LGHLIEVRLQRSGLRTLLLDRSLALGALVLNPLLASIDPALASILLHGEPVPCYGEHDRYS